VTAIKWLPEALADVERIYDFLKEKNPHAAARAIGVILEAAGQLEGMPRIGRPMPDDTARRELFAPFAAGAYVLRYMPEGDDGWVIIRVWHSREHKTE
jgi:plasmid stabilization system protein ParE